MKVLAPAIAILLGFVVLTGCDQSSANESGELCTVRSESFGVSITYSGEGAAAVCVARVENDASGAEGWTLIRTGQATETTVCSGSLEVDDHLLRVTVREATPGQDFARGFCTTVDVDESEPETP
jgi:hypothetical protein